MYIVSTLTSNYTKISINVAANNFNVKRTDYKDENDKYNNSS